MPPRKTKGEPVPPALFVESGTSGLRRAGGYISSDFIPKLSTLRTAALAYQEMSRNDPVLFGIIYAITMVSRRIKWRVEPNQDNKADKAAKDAAAWLKRELFQRMVTPWSEVMADTATKFVYGFAPLEVQYAKRENGDIGVERMALRAQETIDEWKFDGDTSTLLGVWQQDPNIPHRRFIDAQKLLNFRTTAERGSPEGLSLLRGAYISYVRQRAIEEAEGRAALRSAGIVRLRLPRTIMEADAAGPELAARGAWTVLAQQLAEDRQGYVLMSSEMLPEGGAPAYDIDYIVADGRRPADMSPVIERIKREKAGSVLADFILLGSGTGSFAMHQDKTTLFTESITGFADIDEDVLNRGLVTRLWRFNGWPEETQPRILHGELTKADIQVVGSYVDAMLTRGLFSPVQELSDHMADLAEVPRTKVAPPPPTGPGGAPLPPKAGPKPPEPEPEPEPEQPVPKKARRPTRSAAPDADGPKRGKGRETEVEEDTPPDREAVRRKQ